ncbi:MAG: hypoxanthine phosphoribosyltransferase [Magnetococcales bacterium]|nr:hypoxanthine phosphoribosyltransferase [Magnetococcales bacterium]
MNPPVLHTVLDETRISQRITELAQELLPVLKPNPIILAILKGAFIFAADLVRALSRLSVNPRVDFITASSYGAGTSSPGAIQIILDHTLDIRGHPVILLDEILDSGYTLKTLQTHLINKGAAEVITVVLLDKPSGRQVNVQVDHVGFQVPDGFMVGYGLDHDGNYRGLPHISRMQ